jgi:hypothetical protein
MGVVETPLLPALPLDSDNTIFVGMENLYTYLMGYKQHFQQCTMLLLILWVLDTQSHSHCTEHQASWNQRVVREPEKLS